jgi:hypothetical protein
MGAPPYALSISHFVSSVGADAGFAAIIGLAILVLLYFAQARETASLRDRFAEAAEQVRQLEVRVAHLSRPVQAAAPQPTVAPRPAAAVNAPVPSRAVRALPSSEVPMAPAGVGAPALSAATRLIPSGDRGAIAIRAGRGRVGSGLGVGAAAGAAGGVAVAEAEDRAGAPQASAGGGVIAPAGPAPATAAGAAAGSGGVTGGGGPARPTNGGGRTPAPAPASGAGAPVHANGGAGPAAPPRPGQDPNRVKRIGATSAGGQSGPPRRPLAPPPSAQRSRFPRALMIVFGLLVLGAIVAAFLVLTSSNSNTNNAKSGTSGAISKAPNSSHRRTTRAAVLRPAQVTVAVLNGTSTSNLAHDVSLKLTNAGYKPATIATATDQTQSATTVGYVPGQRRAAVIVARSLNLGTTAIQPVTQSNRAVACPQATCTAQVVVTVGADLASVATTSPPPSSASAGTTT